MSARTVLALLLVSVALYGRGLGGEFVIDDRTFFVENDDLPNLGLLEAWEVFRRPTNSWGDWQPVRDLLFVIQHRLFGDATAGYHVVSILLNAAACLLAFALARALFAGREHAGGAGAARVGLAAGVVALLFATHPVHVEAVAYVCGQKELLFSAFSLASLLCFLRAFEGGEGATGRLAGGVALYYLALLSKQSAVMLAALVPLLWLLADPQRRPAAARSLVVWFAVNVPAAAWMVVSRRAFQALWSVNTELSYLPPAERLPVALKLLGAHARLAVWPHPLAFGYPFDGSARWDSNMAAGALAIVLAASVAWVFRRERAVLFAIAIFFGFLVPVLQLHGSLNNASVYDRYLYLPVFGLAIVVERIARAILAERSLGAYLGAAAAAAVAGGALTVQYVPAFADDVAVTRNAYERFPGWRRTPFELAYSLLEAGRVEEARLLIERDRSLDTPPWVRPYLEGWGRLAEGRHREAIPILEWSTSLALQGGYYPFPAIPLARALLADGRLREAEVVSRLALGSPIYQPLERYHAGRLLGAIRARGAAQGSATGP